MGATFTIVESHVHASMGGTLVIIEERQAWHLP